MNINSEASAAIAKLCVCQTPGISGKHVHEMQGAVWRGFFRLIEHVEDWRDKLSFRRIFEDVHPVDIVLGDGRSVEFLSALSVEERVYFGFEPPIHDAAYKAYWQRLWLCTFYVLRALRSDPLVRVEALSAV